MLVYQKKINLKKNGNAQQNSIPCRLVHIKNAIEKITDLDVYLD